jgi:hypothetical protein
MSQTTIFHVLLMLQMDLAAKKDLNSLQSPRKPCYLLHPSLQLARALVKLDVAIATITSDY